MTFITYLTQERLGAILAFGVFVLGSWLLYKSRYCIKLWWYTRRIRMLDEDTDSVNPNRALVPGYHYTREYFLRKYREARAKI